MRTGFVLLEGVPQGGAVEVFALLEDGRTFMVSVRSRSGAALRVLADELVDAFEEAGLPRPGTVDYAHALVRIAGSAALHTHTGDPGLILTPWFLDGEAVLDSSTAASGYWAAPRPDAEPDPDERVLDALTRYVGSLASQAEQSRSLLHGLASAQKTYVQGIRALLLGTEMPEEPNPGPGGRIVAPQGMAQRALGELGAFTPAALDKIAKLADGRAGQVEAIEKKEREAKQGGPGGGGGGGGTGTQTRPPGGGTGAPASVAPPGEQGGPATAATGLPPGAETGLRVRPAGSEEPYQLDVRASEVREYRCAGLRWVVAKVGDKWYLAKDYVAKEFLFEGRTIVRWEYELGQFGEDPGDEAPIEIDLVQLERTFEACRRRQAAGEDPWATATSVIAFALDMLPVVGDLKGVGEAIIGRDLVTNETLSTSQRVVGALLVLLPLAGPVLRGPAKAALRTLGRAVHRGEQVAEAGLRQVDEVVDELSTSRKLETAPGVRRLDDVARQADDILAGVSAARRKCFAAGTRVLLPDGGTEAIEMLRPGDRILAMSGAAVRPRVDAPVERALLATRSARVPRTVRLTLRHADGSGALHELVCTPRHPLGTPDRYVAAEELVPGQRLLGNGGIEVVATEPAGPAEVFNLSVEEDQCFCVSALGVLAHNYCEKVSQAALDRIMPTRMRYLTDANGNPLREPVIGANGQSMGFSRNASWREKADALGIPHEGLHWTEVRDRVLPHLKDTTAPDAFGELTQAWGHLPAGTTVSVELKTVGDVVQDGAIRQRTMREQFATWARSSDNWVLDQQSFRVTNLQGQAPRHVLVIDVSEAAGFSRTAPVGRQADDALAELRSIVADPSLPFGKVPDSYPDVAFMVRQTDGTTVLTSPVPIRP